MVTRTYSPKKNYINGRLRRARWLATQPDEPFSVTVTGLTNGEAPLGSHASISYTTDPVSATETVKWSDSSDPAAAATWGTGASPTDYTSTTVGTLWLHVTDNIDGEDVTVSRSAPIPPQAFTSGQWTLTAA